MITPSGMFAAAWAIGAADEGTRSSNTGAGVAGFVLLVVWVLVAVAQVLRSRRRRRVDLGDSSDGD